MKSTRPYQACTRCIMDTVADNAIAFDARGVCHHCARYDRLLPSRVLRGDAGRQALGALIARMKREGRGREYDCLIGVSGGVDSTYVAYLVKQHGLRALAVHLDNNWNSELAVKNIERVLKRLDIDLVTRVLDWEEFRDLQIAFLKASTPDGEIPTDHAIVATLWREALARGIRFIVSGMNFATESIYVPDWAYGHIDWRYITDVHRRFGTVPLATFPHITLPSLVLYVNGIRRIRTISILNYGEYRKEDAKEILQKELGWEYYGGKHHESIYTRFYQGWFLPKKFGIDKRYGHLSDLIKAGQMTRDEALEEMRQPPYAEDVQRQDVQYVCKKFGFTDAQFDEIMNTPPKTFRDYRNSFDRMERLRGAITWLRSHGLYPR